MQVQHLLPILRRLIPDQRIALIADTPRGRLAEECTVAEVAGLSLSARFEDGTTMMVPLDDIDFVAVVRTATTGRR